ncbi:MAG TPA: RtcB family protein [Balneolales bacterium]|nr:RtcB family protein [Balneolales bacterium]
MDINLARFNIQKITDTLWEIPREGGMRVPARIYATERMMEQIVSDQAPQQAANVAWLPGILRYSMAMPDIHWGYGFPIGGVAAFDLDDGIISPGGVGYDINCGVRLLASNLDRSELVPVLRDLVDSLFKWVPTGVGATGKLKVTDSEERKVMLNGARWAVDNGYGTEEDLEHIEEHGQMYGPDPETVSQRARERGRSQLGTLGSGNHFLEAGYVSDIYDQQAAEVLGLRKDQVTVIIHCGSRGFGYQVCDDYIREFQKVLDKYHIELPDRQLVCAPIRSPEGQRYLGAMRSAVNYAFANRQVITHWTRNAFEEVLHRNSNDIGLRVVYEVAHNIAKIEEHSVGGERKLVCVHRKGATRAYGPGSPDIPEDYRFIGQPVLIPGDMGRYSYVLVGTEKAMQETWGSTCHGAGRRMSRRQAKNTAKGRSIERELEEQGIIVKGASRGTVVEEIPEAYKDVTDVVEACEKAGISKIVARLKPLGVIKG